MKTLILSTLPMISSASAATFYQEISSTDWQTPFRRDISIGANTIQGDLLGEGFCPIYQTLIVPNGLQISSIDLIRYESTAGNESFLGLQTGGTLRLSPALFESPPAGTAREDLTIGDLRISSAAIGRDNLLQDLTAESSLGASDSLGPGEYALWFNETSRDAARFEIQFNATPIPEPSAAILTALASLSLLRRKPSHS